MTITPTTDVGAIRRVERGDEADALTREVFARLIETVRGLGDAEWRRATECPGWTVRDMMAHVVGASVLMAVRQLRYGRANKSRFGGNDLDAMNEFQIRLQDQLGNADLVDELERVVEPSIAGRRWRARWLGRASVPVAPGGSTAPGMPDRLTMAELCTITYTRDAWLHRLDIARAIDAELIVDPAVDGRVVADVVADWCSRHGQPVDLNLTGPAGGRFVQGAGGPALEIDALDLCRVLSGRRPDGAVPDSPLLQTRVLF
jgi:uncharacterized protein (TIGR03083 family)